MHLAAVREEGDKLAQVEAGDGQRARVAAALQKLEQHAQRLGAGLAGGIPDFEAQLGSDALAHT